MVNAIPSKEPASRPSMAETSRDASEAAWALCQQRCQLVQPASPNSRKATAPVPRFHKIRSDAWCRSPSLRSTATGHVKKLMRWFRRSRQRCCRQAKPLPGHQASNAEMHFSRSDRTEVGRQLSIGDLGQAFPCCSPWSGGERVAALTMQRKC